MNNSSLIDPYKLFGIDPNNPSLKKLKKKYYNLALICHPDKGGDKKSMDIIYKSYLYIKNQFDNCSNIKNFEELENEFEEFCRNQKNKPPPFRNIWEESDECKKMKEFNKEFDKLSNDQKSFIEVDYFDLGYGHLMDKSEYVGKSSKLKKFKKINCNIKKQKHVKNTFSNEMIFYKKIQTIPIGYGNIKRFDTKKINDFSGKVGYISMCDYKKAFSENKFEDYEIINEKIYNFDKEYKDLLKKRACDYNSIKAVIHC